MDTPKKTRQTTRIELVDLEKEFTFGMSPIKKEQDRRDKVKEIIQIAIDNNLGWNGTCVHLPRTKPKIKDNLTELGVK